MCVFYSAFVERPITLRNVGFTSFPPPPPPAVPPGLPEGEPQHRRPQLAHMRCVYSIDIRFNGASCRKSDFLCTSRRRQTPESSLPSMCCGSQAERAETTTTPSAAATGLQPIRDSTCRPSRRSSSSPMCRTWAPIWGGRRRICDECGESSRVTFFFLLLRHKWWLQRDALTSRGKSASMTSWLRSFFFFL